MKAINRLICALLSVTLLSAVFLGCGQSGGVSPFSSYRDIPGVTEDEINAIEALRERTGHFVFGKLPGTEAFRGTNGGMGGFSALLCEWLTELFGIPFILELHTWDNLLAGLASGEIDFAGDLTANEERRKIYYMTDAIAERMVYIFRIADSAPLTEIAASRPPRYAFLEGATTIKDVTSALGADASYELLLVHNLDHAYSMLKSGEADAFFTENSAIAAFDVYGDVTGKHFFPPLLISPVSMSTQNPELEPIINLVQKALQNSSVVSYLADMYSRGNSEYTQHTLFMRLTEEERAYIRDNPVIPYVTQYNNYPMSFYNEREKQWQGIAFDLLREIEKLTGLSFQLAHGDEFIRWPFLLEMVETGQAAFVSELIRTEERIGRFIWLDTTLATEYLTLASRSEMRGIMLNEVQNFKVGVIRNTGQTQAFNRWFPNHGKTVEYDDTRDAFLAMRRGEVDLVMTSTGNMLVMLNYLELTGYKANIVFEDSLQGSTFGFNVDRVILSSIIDKALALINVKAITDEWKNRTFDYRYKLIEAQRPWLIGAMALSLIILALVSVLLVRSRNTEKVMEKIVVQRTSELALQTSMLDTMLDSIPDHVFCKDLNLNYTLCNKIMMDYFGLDKDSVIGKGDTECLRVSPQAAEEIRCAERKVIGDGQRSALEEWVPSSDSDRRLFETIRVPLVKDGAVIGLIGIAHDITERKMMEEEARSASRSKSAFLATMSHEIRTPMNAILGITEIQLHDETLAPNTREALGKIYNSGELLLGIINDILDLSKIEAGKLELMPAEYKLANLISDTAALNMMRIGGKPIEFELHVDENTPSVLIGDELRIKQILNNLLSNAFKYTEKGLVKLSISAEGGEEEPETTLIVKVSDTGHGMTEEQQNKVFDAYTRFNVEANRMIEGAGLGMSITYNLVRLMSGEITVKSEPGAGTIFVVRLPQAAVGANVLGKEMAESLRGFRMSGAKQIRRAQVVFEPMPYGRVLVVDDVESNLYVVKGLLAPYKLSVDTVMSGFGAIDKIKDGGEYDIVFMDHMMPQMDGMEAAKIMRGMGYALPIVALTANALAGQAEVFLANGFDGFISKPIDVRELNATLKKFIRDKQPPEVIEAARRQNEV
ncbi:MAG: transporter substrate-binding domain-containing protein [Synergistaceae bacterium]|nr:transporter substrate-binding domain-containing protein [Synergistaceae bacterium]